MGMKEIIDLVNNVNGLLLTIYSDLAQPGVQKVGMALETVLDLSNTILLPVKLVNEKSQANFSNHMKKYKEKLERIEESEITTVPPEIGIPILDKLTYYRNEEISQLFINLLSTASSCITIENAHPSYVKVIERLSVDEARIINYLAVIRTKTIPYIFFQANVTNKNPDKDFVRDMSNLTMLEEQVELLFPIKIHSYLENLVSNGILSIHEGTIDPDLKDNYSKLTENYTERKKAVEQMLEAHEYDFDPIQTLKGFYRVTAYGEGFIEACTD